MASRHKRKTIIVGTIATMMGIAVGNLTAPAKIEFVTVSKLVEVPTVSRDTAPDKSFVYQNVPLSHYLQDHINQLCADEGIPAALIFAMIEHGSGFNQEVVNNTYDHGLMQINEINHASLAAEYRCGDILNPYQNVYAGVKIMGRLIRTYGDYNKALMAYNMGEYGAQKAWESGIETTDYSISVLQLMAIYEEAGHVE